MTSHCCKPNFIHFVLKRSGLPVLYVDADVVFRETPRKVFQLVQEQIDFAIYNWLADNACDAYAPADFPDGTAAKGRFYRFSHRIDLYDPTQLIGGGSAQDYTSNAERLLRG
jgi:hypothetical protein